VTFIISGGLILLGGCSNGLGLLAFIGAFLLGGVVASGISYLTSRPNSRDEVFLARIQHDLAAGANEPASEPASEPNLEDDEADDETSPPRRQFGELEVQPFYGAMGRIEPGDRLRLHVSPSEDDDEGSPLRGDLTGRYLGTQLVDGRRYLVLELVGTDRGSYQTIIPVEHADRLTKITAGD
jgi:hypothetical protein